MAALLVLAAGRGALAWNALAESVAFLPQPPRAGAGATTPIFGYADLTRIREDGDLSRLLTVGWPNLFSALDDANAMPRSIGIPGGEVRRILHAGSPQQPFVVIEGGPGFASAVDERLVTRGFTTETLGQDRLYSRWPDDHLDSAMAEPGDPFGFDGLPQRLLAFDNALAGGIEDGAMRALHERRLADDASALARGMLAAIAPIRAGLPQGISVLQAAAFWPDSFLTGESARHSQNPARPQTVLPEGAEAFSPRLPPFAFSLFVAAELHGSPVLIVAAAYESLRDAQSAAPVIASGVQALGTGDGPPPTRVHDWAIAGNGMHVAVVTVLFGDAPRAQASRSLRHWLQLVDAREFTPLDAFH